MQKSSNVSLIIDNLIRLAQLNDQQLAVDRTAITHLGSKIIFEVNVEVKFLYNIQYNILDVNFAWSFVLKYSCRARHRGIAWHF